MNLTINTDGGARGNPGPAGIGVAIADEQGNIISTHKNYISEATNNVAEYKALILALEQSMELSKVKGQMSNVVTLQIRMDSELIVRQMQGKYKIKEPTLKVLAGEVLVLIKNFKAVTFKHIPREQNKL